MAFALRVALFGEPFRSGCVPARREPVRDTGAEALWRACSSAIRVSIAPLIRFGTGQYGVDRPCGEQLAWNIMATGHLSRNCVKAVDQESYQIKTIITAALALPPKLNN